MAIREQIFLDLRNPSQFVNVRIQQGDHIIHQIEATITLDGEIYDIPDNTNAYISMLKLENKPVFNQCIIENNTVTFNITKQMSRMAGRQPAQIEFINITTGGVFKTLKFHMLVEEAAVPEEMIVNTSELGALTDALVRVEDVAQTMGSNLVIVENANRSEQQRILNENKRIQDENTRIQKETLRWDYRTLTKAQYDALPLAEKHDPKIIYEIIGTEDEFPNELVELIDRTTTAASVAEELVIHKAGINDITPTRTEAFSGQKTQAKFNELDTKHGEVVSQLRQKAAQTELEIVDAKVNNIVATSTSTDGNTELVDIRVGADGVTYPTAGEANRKQFSALSSELLFSEEQNNDILYNNAYNIYVAKSHLVRGVISTSNQGEIASSVARLTSTRYFFMPSGLCEMVVPTGYKAIVGMYDTNKIWKRSITRTSTGTITLSTDEKYIRVSFAYLDDRSVTVDNHGLDLITNIKIRVLDANQILKETKEDVKNITEQNGMYLVLNKNELKDYISLGVSYSSNITYGWYIASNRNLFPSSSINYYNNNDTKFNNIAMSVPKRLRTTSFAVPPSKNLVLSGIPTGISLSSVRAYDRDTNYLENTILLTKNTDSYVLTLTTKNISYIHLLFLKDNDAAISANEISSASLQLEIGTIPTTHIAHNEVRYSQSVNTLSTNIEKNFTDDNIAVLYTDQNTFNFHLKQTKKVKDDVNDIKSKVVTKDLFDELTQYVNDGYMRDITFNNNAYRWHTPTGNFDEFTMTTQLSEYNDKIISLTSAYPDYFKRIIAGKDASDALNMYRYEMAMSKVAVPGYSKKRPKIVIISGQHGYEKGAPYIIYYLIRDLLQNWKSNQLLEFLRWECDLVIMPVVNPWGFNAAIAGSETGYGNANGVNLNRDYNNDTPQVETQYVKTIMEQHKDALFFIDLHTNGTTRTTANWTYCNWLSLRNEAGIPILKSVQGHIATASRYICDEWGLDYREIAMASMANANNDETAGALATRLGTPCLTFEASHKFPLTETTEFSPSTQKFNYEVFVNFLGRLISEYKKIYDIVEKSSI